MDWLYPSLEELAEMAAKALLVYAAVIVATRAGGLRTFAKLGSFDFAMTVATGSVIASTVLGPSSAGLGAVAFATLVLLQVVVALARQRFTAVERLVTNSPIMLMDVSHFLDDNLRHGRVAREDVFAAVRQAGVDRLDDVRAVVLETTGEVSVIAGGSFDEAVLSGVRRNP